MSIPISNFGGLNPQTVEAKGASLDTCSSLSWEMKNSIPSSRGPLLVVVPFMAGGEEDIKGLTFSYFLLPILFAVLTLEFLGTVHKMYA